MSIKNKCILRDNVLKTVSGDETILALDHAD